MLAAYDHKNPIALKSLDKAGVKLHAFPQDVMAAAQKVAFDLYEAEAAKNESFRKIYTEWKQYRDTEFQWFKLAEASYNDFVLFNK